LNIVGKYELLNMVCELPSLKIEESAQFVPAGIAEDTLLALYFLPPHLTEAVDQNFYQNILSDPLQNLDPFMVHAC
jgi:hypothetical protein